MIVGLMKRAVTCLQRVKADYLRFGIVNFLHYVRFSWDHTSGNWNVNVLIEKLNTRDLFIRTKYNKNGQ